MSVMKTFKLKCEKDDNWEEVKYWRTKILRVFFPWVLANAKQAQDRYICNNKHGFNSYKKTNIQRRWKYPRQKTSCQSDKPTVSLLETISGKKKKNTPLCTSGWHLEFRGMYKMYSSSLNPWNLAICLAILTSTLYWLWTWFQPPTLYL